MKTFITVLNIQYLLCLILFVYSFFIVSQHASTAGYFTGATPEFPKILTINSAFISIFIYKILGRELWTYICLVRPYVQVPDDGRCNILFKQFITGYILGKRGCVPRVCTTCFGAKCEYYPENESKRQRY